MRQGKKYGSGSCSSIEPGFPPSSRLNTASAQQLIPLHTAVSLTESSHPSSVKCATIYPADDWGLQVSRRCFKPREFSLLSDRCTTDLSLPTSRTHGKRTLHIKIIPVPVTIDNHVIQLFKNWCDLSENMLLSFYTEQLVMLLREIPCKSA